MFEEAECSVSSSAMSPQLSQPAGFAASVKLPEFWQSDPAAWFQHVEALFHLRRITEDDSRYFLVVAALDQHSTRRVMQLLRDPPRHGKYAALRQLLLRRYSLSAAERADKMLALPGLGDGSAVDLMDSMLSPLGSDVGGFLFPHIFLRQLPPPVRAALANSPCLTASDYRGLAEEADRVLLATRRFSVQSVSSDPRQWRAGAQQWWLEFPGGDSAEAPCVFSTSVMAPRLGVASLRARLRCRETPEPALSSSCERWRAKGAAVFEGLPVRQAFPGGLRLPEVPASSD